MTTSALIPSPMPCLMAPTRSVAAARVPCIFQFPATSGCRITTPNSSFRSAKMATKNTGTVVRNQFESSAAAKDIRRGAIALQTENQRAALSVKLHAPGVDAFHHHPNDRLGTGSAQQHPALVVEFGNEFAIGALHEIGTIDVEARRHPHVDHALRKFVLALFQVV